MPASGHGSIRSYLVPTAKQGGIWASGGPVVSPAGMIYVSAGNGATSSGSFDGSDSVTALTPGLKRTGIFAPADWRALSAADLDLGSVSPALLGDGRILQVGKNGVGYLLDAANLGGVGGQLAQGPVCAADSGGAFGGAAVSGTVVYMPCTSGLVAVDTANDQPEDPLARARQRLGVARARRRRRVGGQPGLWDAVRARAWHRQWSASRSTWADGCPTSSRRACPAASSWSGR